MHIVPVELQKPKNEADFERMCAQIYGVVFKDSLPKINGRKGQAQGGVDVFVEADGIGRIGIQCKKYFQTTLAWKHVVEEVDKADKFKTPIQRLLIATTSPNDAALLKKVQILSDDRRKAGKFGVEVEFWDDIEIRIESHAILQDSYNPGAAGAAFHRQAGEIALIKGIAVETRNIVAALDSLPSGSDTSVDKLITAQLDRTNELIKAGCYRDALAHVDSIGKDLGPFDAHQKARWFLQRGLCLWFSKDDADEAASLFLKASETYPGDERMAAAGIRGLMMRKDLSGALDAGKAASERFPVSLQVWLALANARMLSGTRITPEDAPAASRDEPDVLQFAALSARESGDLAGAVEFARAAVAKPVAGFFNRSLFLRLAVEHCSREPVLAQYGLIPKDRLGRLAEAVATFEPRKECLWDVQSDAVTETVAHLGFAFLLLRTHGRALDLAQEARTMGRASTDLLRVEIQALDESGRREEALAAAKAVIEDLPPEALAAACEIAAGDGDDVFVEKAMAEAVRRFPEKPEVADYLTGLRWGALARTGRKDAAVADILRSPPASLPGVVLPSAAARVLRWAGRPIEAAEAADRAFAGLAADASAADRLLVADLLSLFERWGEAASLYEGLLAGAGPGPSDLHARLLECYAESDSRGKAKALLSRMPDGWAEHDETRHQAINLGRKAVDWAFLAPLAERQSVKAPGEASSWLFRLRVLMHTAEPAVFQGEVRRIPEDLTGSIRNRAILAGVELRYDEGAKGLRRLYRLLRQNLDEPEAFSAYLVNFMTGKLPPIDDAPSVVSPGCFVEFEETEGGRREIVVLDPADAGALPKRDGFLPPSDPDAAPFVGAKPGDEVDVPMMAGGARRVKVVTVGSAYRHMAGLAEERARSLRGIPWLKSVQVGSTGDPQKDLARMHEEIRRTNRVSEQFVEAYASGAMTLSRLAKALGRSPVEVCVGWPGDGPPLFVGLGTGQERDAALLLMRNPEAVFVADSTALAELARLEVGHALGALPKVLVSTATKEIVDALAADAETDDSFGSAFDAGGQLGFVEFDDRRKKQRLAFTRTLSDIVGRCEVAPAYGDLGDSENARGMAKVMGPEEREMLLLAKERGAVVLTLDGRIRMLARHVFGIEGIWPQALVMRALEAGVVTGRQASAFAVGEFLSNRTFVSLRSEDLTWMVSQGDAWLQRGVSDLKRYLAAADTDRDSSLDVVLGFLRGVVMLNTQLGAFGELLFHVSEAMFRRADRRPDLRILLTGFVVRLLEDAAPKEHILEMVNLHRDRELAMRKSLLVSRIKEAESRAKTPPSSERSCRKTLFIRAFCGEPNGISSVIRASQFGTDPMARYKRIDTNPRFIAVDLERQLHPGTFEHALNYLVDHRLDLTRFDARYKNDLTGACAYPPAMLLKVVLFAYSRGIVSSRDIERACQEHVTFIALSGDSAPHFTTFASFVSTLGAEIGPLFQEVLLICDRQGLIGREMFAIDGVKLPSNASKARSGTRADFERQADKMEAAAQAMLARHRENDALPVEPDQAAKEARQIERLDREAAQMRQWLSEHPVERKGAKGRIIKSNRTDNDSAKMATSKGVIQGYCGVAAVDAKHQIIIEAQAHGTGSEQALLMPMVEAAAPLCTADTLITADAGYHSEANIQALAQANRPALIADNGMRKRDERFKDQAKYKALPDPLYDKAHPKKAARHYRPVDFRYDAGAGTCVCPAGKSLYRNGGNCKHNGRLAVKFHGALRDCRPCALRDRCLRTPQTTPARQVSFFYGPAPGGKPNYSELMKQAIDSERGRALYGGRFATVEPVFANIRHNKGLDRFTLRGQPKVDTQWKLFCLVHNIEKLAHYGYAQ